MLPQLACGDICRIWMWFKWDKSYFRNTYNGENNRWSFSNPWSQKHYLCLVGSMELFLYRCRYKPTCDLVFNHLLSTYQIQYFENLFVQNILMLHVFDIDTIIFMHIYTYVIYDIYVYIYIVIMSLCATRCNVSCSNLYLQSLWVAVYCADCIIVLYCEVYFTISGSATLHVMIGSE